jgi:hypothetical protein
MPRWVHSRRLKAFTLAATGLLLMGTCGGAMLANYTVAGMDPVYVARPAAADPQPSRGVADWAAEQAFKSAERDREPAQFADPWKPEAADYQRD